MGEGSLKSHVSHFKHVSKVDPALFCPRSAISNNKADACGIGNYQGPVSPLAMQIGTSPCREKIPLVQQAGNGYLLAPDPETVCIGALDTQSYVLPFFSVTTKNHVAVVSIEIATLSKAQSWCNVMVISKLRCAIL